MYCVCWVLCTQLCITLIKTAGLNGELANALLLLFTGEFFVLFAGFIHAVAHVLCLCMCEYSLSSCVCTRVGGLRGPSPGVVKQRVEP